MKTMVEICIVGVVYHIVPKHSRIVNQCISEPNALLCLIIDTISPIKPDGMIRISSTSEVEGVVALGLRQLMH
jgi:hypothetical protein